jgi:putative ABC transport system permease protein
MLRLALRNLWHRPLRNGLALAGLGMAVAVLAWLSAFGAGYRRALASELDRTGLQLMVVPLGCPYDAAARVLKGNTLDNSLPESALASVRQDPDVALAAPLFMAALPRQTQGHADVWVGLDTAGRQLKPWWQAKAGVDWFPDAASVILGSEAAEVELRSPGDKLFSPETGRTYRVAGVLERSGTSDDSLFFLPLHTAQEMFHQPGRLTAIAVRLRDPMRLRAASERLQGIPGAQVVTLTEVMGTFLNLVASVRTLTRALALLAITISALSVWNTLLAAVVERQGELCILRALGASRAQLFALLAMEALLLTGLGGGLGVILAMLTGPWLERAARAFVPFAPSGSLSELSGRAIVESVLLGIGVGLFASLYPAWQASRAEPAVALREGSA